MMCLDFFRALRVVPWHVFVFSSFALCSWFSGSRLYAGMPWIFGLAVSLGSFSGPCLGLFPLQVAACAPVCNLVLLTLTVCPLKVALSVCLP